MTDKELLELAAKALGFRAHFNIVDACQLWTHELDSKYISFWNPLLDDGDALRLCVKLGLDLYPSDESRPAAYASCFIGTRQLFATEQHNNDSYAATRRAIVRAAAEIGKAKL